MAQMIRSRLSARHAKAPLYVMQAEDFIQDRPWNLSLEDATRGILRHPNMNDTGRLPGIALLHIGMHVRITMTLEQGVVPVDSTGVVLGIDFHPDETLGTPEHLGSVRVLRHLPSAVLVKLDDSSMEFMPPVPCRDHTDTGPSRACSQCKFFPGVFAVEPKLSRTFRVDVVAQPTNTADTDAMSEWSLKVQRRQMALTISTASTLHTLQGSTTEPGLIFHWNLPHRLTKEMKWLAVYVALSRTPSLAQLRSVGLSPAVRKTIEAGPPAGLVTRFAALFDEKIEQSALAAQAAMEELGWTAV